MATVSSPLFYTFLSRISLLGCTSNPPPPLLLKWQNCMVLWENKLNIMCTQIINRKKWKGRKISHLSIEGCISWPRTRLFLKSLNIALPISQNLRQYHRYCNKSRIDQILKLSIWFLSLYVRNKSKMTSVCSRTYSLYHWLYNCYLICWRLSDPNVYLMDDWR